MRILAYEAADIVSGNALCHSLEIENRFVRAHYNLVRLRHLTDP